MFASANAVLAISGACLANSLYMRENALVPGGEFWSSFFKVPPPKKMMARHGFNLVYIYICTYMPVQLQPGLVYFPPRSLFQNLGWSKAKLQINMNIPGKINTSWAQQPWSRVREGTRETQEAMLHTQNISNHTYQWIAQMPMEGGFDIRMEPAVLIVGHDAFFWVTVSVGFVGCNWYRGNQNHRASRFVHINTEKLYAHQN